MTSFEHISRKALAGERLSEDDALFLFEYPDLMQLGALANEINLKRNGVNVFFNINRHINPTNICAMSCKFCAYSKKPGEEGSYAYSIDEILQRASAVVAEGATEVHMVGGLHPRWRLQNYIEIVSALHQSFPQLHIKAFTAVEIDWLARKERMTHDQVLAALQNAGLGSLPGGGAEIFHPEVRDVICDTKTDANRWLNIHRVAHERGMRTNCTMLYGHIETFAHRVDHMSRLRILQDATQGFNVFIPLAFQPQDNDMGIEHYTSGPDDLRTIAVARLFLDNFRHIKAYWVMLGQDIAQMALHFGANDLDGTVTEEKISRAAGGRAGIVMSRVELEGLIIKAGRTPVERDTLYNTIQTHHEMDSVLLEPSATQTQMHLDRILHGEDPTLEQALHLAKEASLHHLAMTATAVRCDQKTTAPVSIGMGLKVPTLDSEDQVNLALEQVTQKLTQQNKSNMSYGAVVDLVNEKHKLTHICQFANKLHELHKNTRVIVRGVKGMWHQAQINELDVSEIFARFAKTGVVIFESSSDESESDLTTSDLFDIHKAAHQHDIQTVAKLEINAQLRGHEPAFWEAFVKKAFSLREMQSDGMGLKAVTIEPAVGSLITTVEFLRAVSLASIILDNVPQIITPYHSIPTLRDFGAGTLAVSEPMLKIAPLCLAAGASDLGLLDIEADQPNVVARELEACGFSPKWRSPRYEMM